MAHTNNRREERVKAMARDGTIPAMLTMMTMVAPPHVLPEMLTQTAEPEHSDVLELMADVEEMDPEETRLAREAWKKYGDDFGRRLGDLEAGRHPYQRRG